MNPRMFASLAIAASSLVVTACGHSNTPAPASGAATAPANQSAPLQTGAATPEPTMATVAPAPAAVAVAPAPTVAVVAPAAKSEKLVVQGFSSQVPGVWTPTQPSSPMRFAQFALPPSGAESGEVAGYFFATGKGGSHEDNIERWVSQFVSTDGKPVVPKVSTSKSDGGEVTLVELHGNYARGIGMGPTGNPKPDQTLMVAMVETSAGRITLQMYGPNKTVSAQRKNFVKLANGFHPA